jgi:subfamily B ATP-binding cassette protein HlyB/CyaB
LHIPRAVISAVLSNRPDAKAWMARYVAISMAGGFLARLFNLRGKLKREELETLIQGIGIKLIREGQVILQQGSSDDRRLYAVRTGRVALTRSEDGIEYPLVTLEQGEVFGEKACLLRQEQPATAIASSDAVLIVLSEEAVHALLERNSKLREVLLERVERLERELERQKKLAERRQRRVLLDLSARPRLGERVVKHFPLVQQAEEKDCGAACLAMICRHYGLPMTLGKLREMAGVTREGASLDSLGQVGESLGFTTRGVKCGYRALLGFDLQFIAHWEGYHFVVVYGVSKNHVWMADPGPGFRKLTKAEFERGWTGMCLLFTPGAELAHVEPARSPWARFVGYLRPYKQVLAHLFLASLVINLLGLAPPVITQNILDRVIVHDNVALLNVLIIGFIITNVFMQLTTLMRSLLVNFVVRGVDFNMMSRFFQHTLSLPLTFFATRRTGDILARFQENQTIRRFLTASTLSTLLNLLMVFIYFTVLFIYSVKMTRNCPAPPSSAGHSVRS